MNSNQIGVLLIAVIVVGVAIISFQLVSKVETDEQRLTGIGTLTPEFIDRITFQDKETQSSIVKSLVDGTWTVEGFPVKIKSQEYLWETLDKLNGANLVATNVSNHDRMGVSENTGTVVQVFSGDKEIEKFIVGDKSSVVVGEKEYTPWSAFVAQCFFRRPGEEQVYGVFCGSPDRFSANINNWGEQLVYDIPLQQMGPMTFIYPDDKFTLSVIDTKWTISTEGAPSELAESDMARQILTSLRRVVANRLPTLDESKNVNFNEPEAVIQVETSESSDISTKTILFVPVENEQGEYYIRDLSQPEHTYVIASFKIDRIMVKRDGLLKNENEEEEVPNPTPVSGG